ncbi:MAG: HAMP domain-containing protein [Acidobacteria bacterium]|nr:HAMP domain-containing protein [Acidobacteriota bacterium]MCA1627644.1 HAMP domain-containing protein [Acidobacteriota bacterium]
MKIPFRSLYLKIFIWFWVAMIIINVATFAIFALTRPTPIRRSWRDLTQVGPNAQRAAEIYEQSGAGALTSALQSTEKSSGVSATFFDESGKELSGRTPPAGTQELLARAAESREIEFNFAGRDTLVARPVVSSKGQRYTYVAHIPRPTFQSGLQPLFFRLLVILVIGGIFCFWLARYLTTPLLKLRTTTNELAEGNLGARVADKLTKRRDEIGQLGRDFNGMAERLESMVKAQQRLLGDISHELRSPLARLGVALGLARQRSGAEANGALDRIERESDNLNEMISQLLTLTRLESGTDGRKRGDVDLAALVRDVAEDADFEARSVNRSVEVVWTERCTINGVEELLRSAVENVVRNAVRFTPEGTAVEVALQRQNGAGDQFAVISVRDHGKGVPEDALERIFRPFYRAEDARDRQSGGGTGLGLAITERAVRMHGGSVVASNAKDGGLSVELRLKL